MWGRRRSALTASIALLVSMIVVVLPAGGAQAMARTAMEKCLIGTVPEFSQTVAHQGGEPATNFPAGLEPDNAIFPGDVVRVTASGSVRHNIWGSSWGPGGDGVPAGAGWPFPGLNQISSVARWNNTAVGWVGGPVPTTSLAGCTTAPPGQPVRLIFAINDGVLWDNGGEWRIKVDVYRAPGRIAVDDDLEFTQSIQTPQADVPMIAGKRTFVRAYVRGTEDDHGPLSGVTATLRVETRQTTIQPVGPRTITVSPWGSDRRTLADSFLFELPADAVDAGMRRITVTVSPPPGRGSPFSVVKTGWVSFGPWGSPLALEVFGVRYTYTNVPPAMQAQIGLSSPQWQARPDSAWEPLRRTAENALPLATLTITDLAPGDPWGSFSVDCRAVMVAGVWSCAGYDDARIWAQNYIDHRCRSGKCWIVVLQPEVSGGRLGYHIQTPAGNHRINLQGEASPAEQGLTLAHEIGHGLTLADTFLDVGFPRTDGGLGPFVGLRYSPAISLVPGTREDGTTAAFDLMSYSSPAWFSPYNYCKALAVVADSRLLCSPTMRG